MENIIYNSPDLIKQTSQYKVIVITIKQSFKKQSSKVILKEKNVLKKALIILKLIINTQNKIKDLTSKRNLY